MVVPPNKPVLRLLFIILLDESQRVYLLRVARWHNGIYCVRCNSGKTKKYGIYRMVFQRYLYHDYRHTFNDKTETVFHYSHTPPSY